MDINIKLSNGQILRGMVNSSGEDTRAMIIFVHGLGEHIQRYTHWFELFRGAGIGFTGVDLPGHGRSDGRRGNISRFVLLDEMLDILLSGCQGTFPGIPVFIYGHSLGGSIILDYLLRMNPKVRGAIVTAPWLRLSFEPDRNRIFLARILKYILPGLVQPSGLVVDHISHDKTVVEKYKNDPLVHNKISVSLFYEAVRIGRYSLAHASELKVPILIMHGTDDQIVSPSGSLDFAGKTNLAELKTWDGFYHEIHNEIFSQDVFAYIINWINKKIDNK
jgi:acylglycerol lipase